MTLKSKRACIEQNPKAFAAKKFLIAFNFVSIGVAVVDTIWADFYKSIDCWFIGKVPPILTNDDVDKIVVDVDTTGVI